MTRRHETNGQATKRCAIYTRKSTEEGLEQEFNSLDAQRESAEAYIKSMKHEGWTLLAESYNDGGFTGSNAERPALRRLMSDIEAHKVDCIVVYKVDRLSRSLLDFSRMMETFERHQVAFVSVTQRFDTSDSMGRLTLNMLMSFAQFERDMISERTRDKIAATRRKGKYSGGMPILGYDVVDTKLVVNDHEAEQVRQIFALYLELGSLLPVVGELGRRGWTTKRWTTKKQTHRGGVPFTKNRLYHLLTNITYIGKVAYKEEVHEGEHEAIVDAELFRRVRSTLEENGSSGGADKRNKHGALLRGLLRCAACDCGMTHSYTKKGNRLYRDYFCNHAQQHGRATCPAPSVPAVEIERFVVDQIKAIGRDPALVAATLAESRRLAEEAIGRLKRERAALDRQRRADEAELAKLAATPAKNGELAQLANVQDRIAASGRRHSEIADELTSLLSQPIAQNEVATALAEFDTLWTAQTPRERVQVLALLIKQINFDGRQEKIDITFRPTGIKTLVAELADHEEHAA
jgi:site-specific DNA recombinase